jgi:hypothetical protein
LQEFSPREHADVMTLLQRSGYECACDGRAATPDTCAVFWRKATFTPVGMPTILSLQSSSGTSSTKVIILQLLEDTASKQRIGIAAAHVPFETSAPAQVAALAQASGHCTFASGRYVVAGDFNVDAAINAGPVAAAFNGWTDVTASLPYTAWTSRGAARIDYIMARGPGVSGGSCSVVPAVADQLIPHKGRQPAANTFFSDHCGVFANITITS